MAKVQFDWEDGASRSGSREQLLHGDAGATRSRSREQLSHGDAGAMRSRSREQLLQGDERDAIRREVQAQITAKFSEQMYIYEQLGEQLKRLEGRMKDLETRMETNPLARFSSQLCSALAPSASDDEGSQEYAPLTRRSAPVFVSGEDGEDQEDDAEELPESMYNYCMQRFTATSNLWRDPALKWYVLLCLMQAIAMNAFACVNDLATTLHGVISPEKRVEATSDCMFSGASIVGVPFMQWCIGYAAIVLVASVVRSDDNDTFKAPFPKVGSGALYWLVNWAWFWQTIYVPGTFGLEAATLFARSADAMEVVMNTLAVTFIMDIDNMLYQNFLSDAEKQAYQQRAGVPIEDPVLASTQCSWAIFAINIFVMMVMFTHVTASIGRANLHGQAYITFYWWSVPFGYLLIFSARFLLQRVYSDPKHKTSLSTRYSSVLRGSVGISLAAAVFGASIYFVGTSLSAARLLVPPFIYFGASEFLACDKG